MKTKGTSVWEQYIEYAVLLVAIAVFCWFAWSNFGPNSEIDKDTKAGKVHSGNVDELLIEVANKLEAGINRGDSPVALSAPEAQYDKFESQLTTSISPNTRLRFPTIDMTADLASNQDVQSELRKYVSPVIPKPKFVRARQWFGTIRESEISSTANLNTQIEGPPHDTMWVQVASNVSIDSILESFGEQEGVAAIPQQWFDGGVDIFDVEVQRQEEVDGAWSQPETISVLEGQLSYREKLADDSIDAIERDAIILSLRSGKQSEIVNPEFYALNGYRSKQMDNPSTWFGVDEFEKSPLQLMKELLQLLEERIAKQEDEIQKINNDISALGGGGSGGRGGGSSGSQDQKIERLKKKLDRSKETLVKLQEQKSTLETEIEDASNATSLEQGLEVLQGEIWVWGHDMDIRPSATYRYRIQLQIANPFYGHKPSLYEEQKQLANKVVLVSAQSDWSEPITVQDSGQWFVKSAKPADDFQAKDVLDYGYVSIEVCEFTDGMWTKNSRDVRVGQPLALDGTDWFVLDVMEDVDGEVAFLQNLQSGQLLTKRPEVEAQNQQWKYIRQQMKEQSNYAGDGEEGDDDSSDNPPDDPGSGGPIGGGSGGGAR